MNCRVCHREVPTGEFCGHCGATMFRRRGDGADWLRASAYAAAPTERLWSPSLTSTLFPTLPRRVRPAFLAALVVVIGLLVIAAATGLQAPLIGLVGFGLPVVFIAYLRETDAVADLGLRTLAAAVVMGSVLGIGWAFGADAAAAYTDDDALGLPLSTVKLLIVDLAIPLTYLLLMLAPIVAIRMAPAVRSGARESMDGFVLGSLGALSFAAASNITRLAPQLADGLVDDDGRPGIHLVIAGAIQGVAVPLTAAAVGGTIGAALWFSRREDTALRPPRYASIPSAVAIGVMVYLLMGLLEFFPLSRNVVMGGYALLAVASLYVARVFIHCTLLYEAPDTAAPDEPVLCPQCELVVPDMPFCPSCGAAAHAASRTSRAARRAIRPIPASASASDDH